MDAKEQEQKLERIYESYKYHGPSDVGQVIRQYKDIDHTQSADNSEPLSEVGNTSTLEEGKNHINGRISYLAFVVKDILLRENIDLKLERQNLLSHITAVVEELQLYMKDDAVDNVDTSQQQIYPVLDQLAEIEIPIADLEFWVQWRSYNLLLLGGLARNIRVFQLMEKINNSATLLNFDVHGTNAMQKKAFGFSVYNLAVAYKSLGKQGASQLFQIAETACRQSADWTNEAVKRMFCHRINHQFKMIQEPANIDRTKAVIGPAGGVLISSHGKVEIPFGAVEKEKEMRVKVGMTQTRSDEYIIISTTFACEPQIQFKVPVTMKMPTWCGSDGKESIPIKIMSQKNAREKLEEISATELKDINSKIKFRSKFFSNFMIFVKKSFRKRLMYKMAMDVWKSKNNFVFIGYVNDSLIQKIWQEELVAKGFVTTKVILNTIQVKNDEKIKVALKGKHGKTALAPVLTRGVQEFTVNFTCNQVHYEYFTFQSGATDELIMKCTVQHKEGEESVDWIEPMKQEIKAKKMRLEDVFQEEIITEFANSASWRNFARSSHGLALDHYEVQNITENYRQDFKTQQFEMLQHWKLKTGGTDAKLIMKIRQILEDYRKRL